jgi:hypothetical protein
MTIILTRQPSQRSLESIHTFLPGELSRSFECVLLNPCSKIGIVKQEQNPTYDLLNVADGDQKAVLPIHDLVLRSSAIRCHHGASASHRLQDWHRKPFRLAGHNPYLAPRVDVSSLINCRLTQINTSTNSSWAPVSTEHPQLYIRS